MENGNYYQDFHSQPHSQEQDKEPWEKKYFKLVLLEPTTTIILKT